MENDPQVIREEIEATRERLADTAEAIAYKTDVPARVKEDVAHRVDSVKETARDVVATVGASLSDVTQQTMANVHDLTDSAKASLSDATATARDNVGIAAGAAADFVATTREKAAPLADTTRSLADAGAPVARNPLAIALGSIAVGFLIGLVLPVSDMERDNVGPLGENVANRAKTAAGELAEQGKAAVGQAVSDALSRGSAPRA